MISLQQNRKKQVQQPTNKGETYTIINTRLDNLATRSRTQKATEYYRE